jgi:DNA-binding PadR family transcriptional regulator
MSATRLLLLGTVRIFQPVHGYFVRRELLSWHAEAWAHLNPGSVYNGLRSLARGGFVEEVGTEAEGGRPARTTYRLTANGETEFMVLLRAGLWNVSIHDPAELMAAWSFAWALTREEVIAALEHRVEQIAASARATEFAVEGIRRGHGTPDTVAEHFRLTQARLDGEAGWARTLIERLHSGEYWFEGEPDRPWSAPPPNGAESDVVAGTEPDRSLATRSEPSRAGLRGDLEQSA